MKTNINKRVLLTYPMALIEDRYGGTYSGGRWLAIAKANLPDPDFDYPSRVTAMMEEGPSSDDSGAMDFWDRPPSWIAAGMTPEEAIDRLIEKLSNPIDNK